MSTRKTTIFYVLLAMTASLFVGMIIASRLDMTPRSTAQTINVPASNSAPISGPLSADTFRNIAKAASPTVVNIRTTMNAKSQDLTEFFGGQGGSPDDFLHRFFGTPGQQDPGDSDQGGRGGARRGSSLRRRSGRGRRATSSRCCRRPVRPAGRRGRSHRPRRSAPNRGRACPRRGHRGRRPP
jgi:S1-C subfamily serine protease